ncbi:MAG: Crp/Fnr family transcriptional regulator [Chitinophagia bacterium]|jgi:CRP/FNR family transcriptional regulator|nr:Crp/Fnr family transcriptional regulator [Chitinophagia bacterium]
MELKELAPFKSAPQVTEQLQKYGINKSYAEGSVIIQEHNYINSIPIVLSGSIRVMRVDDEGRELLLYYIKAGESCIMSFLSGLHQDTSKIKAIAEEDTELLFVPIEKVSLLIKEFPEWLDYIFKLYHKRFEELLEVVNAVAFKKLDQRLLDFIKNKSSLGNTKEIHITHEQIANELGTARVVVSRLLKQLEEEGIIQLGRNKITLV